jgi:O-methyltransferase
MNNSSASLYLELLKKTLCYSLWDEPPISLEKYNYRRSFLKRFIVRTSTKILKNFNLNIVKNQKFSPSDLKEGKVWPSQATTMIGIKRLDNLQYCIEQVLSDKIPGDFIETGVWRGGACIFMSGVLSAYNVINRKIFVADSFQGIPLPDDDYPIDQSNNWHKEKYLSVSLDEVIENFRKYDLLSEQVFFLEGFFKNTLPNAKIDCLSILRLDGDLYSSTYESLEYLYPKLSVGGYCIIDDYSLDNCMMAVNDYRNKNGIGDELLEIDWTGRFWRKV